MLFPQLYAGICICMSINFSIDSPIHLSIDRSIYLQCKKHTECESWRDIRDTPWPGDVLEHQGMKSKIAILLPEQGQWLKIHMNWKTFSRIFAFNVRALAKTIILFCWSLQYFLLSVSLRCLTKIVLMTDYEALTCASSMFCICLFLQKSASFLESQRVQRPSRCTKNWTPLRVVAVVSWCQNVVVQEFLQQYLVQHRGCLTPDVLWGPTGWGGESEPKAQAKRQSDQPAIVLWPQKRSFWEDPYA